MDEVKQYEAEMMPEDFQICISQKRSKDVLFCTDKKSIFSHNLCLFSMFNILLKQFLTLSFSFLWQKAVIFLTNEKKTKILLALGQFLSTNW